MELPGDRTGLGHAAVLFGEDVADLGYGPVPVIAGEIDQQGATARPIAFQLELFKMDAGKLAGAALDRLLGVVRRHVDVFGFEDCESEAGVAVRITAAEAGGDGDFTDDLGKDLAALGVYVRFVPLRGCPVTMAPHDLAPSRLEW